MDKIYEILCDMGMPKYLLGFEMTHAAVEYLLDNKDIIMMQMYTEVGRRFEVSAATTERRIRTAINKTIQRANEHYFEKLFPGLSQGTGITVSEFVHQVAFMVRNPSNELKPKQCVYVDGYKAFRGTMGIRLLGRKDIELNGDWLYRPDTKSWHCNDGRAYPYQNCTILHII